MGGGVLVVQCSDAKMETCLRRASEWFALCAMWSRNRERIVIKSSEISDMRVRAGSRDRKCESRGSTCHGLWTNLERWSVVNFVFAYGTHNSPCLHCHDHEAMIVLAATACVRSVIRSLQKKFPFSFWLHCRSLVCFLRTFPAALFTSPPNSTASPSTTMRSPQRAPLQEVSGLDVFLTRSRFPPQ